MLFIKLDEPIMTNDLYYDLFEGYIKPEKILHDQKDIEEVKKAIKVVGEFLEGALDSGSLVDF